MIGIKKNLGQPDETRAFPRGKLDVVKLGHLTVGKATFESQWKWSESVKPIAQTKSCEVHHDGYVESGRMHIEMDDGSKLDIGPGDAFDIPPGHDAWVVGNETCVVYDFAGSAEYAKRG